MGDLENRVVVITGAARGIGLGIAEAVADQGACVVLADILYDEAQESAASLRNRDDFPAGVADALATLAAGDRAGYESAVAAVLSSFETRDQYLEDMPVADTVIVLQALAERRGLGARLDSPLLP